MGNLLESLTVVKDAEKARMHEVGCERKCRQCSVNLGKCECNWRYTHISKFRSSRLADCLAKQARETFGFSKRLA